MFHERQGQGIAIGEMDTLPVFSCSFSEQVGHGQGPPHEGHRIEDQDAENVEEEVNQGNL